MLHLTLTETKQKGDRVLSVYTIGGYEVRKVEYPDGISVSVRTNRKSRFLPAIYTRTNEDTWSIEAFEIQTTSYGALELDDMNELIADLREAYEVSQVLTETFIK